MAGDKRRIKMMKFLLATAASEQSQFEQSASFLEMPRTTTTLLLALPLAASAADLGVPLSWRKFSNSRPLAERQNIAQAAIDNIKQYVNYDNYELNGLGYWVSANTSGR
ncbi:hypothetical protein RSAG8_02770, partial [Rhizoctonia solani AG-8 WAC10335]